MGSVADKTHTFAYVCDCGSIVWAQFYDAKGTNGFVEVVHRSENDGYRERFNYGYEAPTLGVASSLVDMFFEAMTGPKCGLAGEVDMDWWKHEVIEDD